ncbi:MAG: glycosyltransferase family 4 protein [Anaerolineae bacterium]|nr:glycosyltransferase family 4 protein [Anaerolineae bacterium]
MRILMLSWEYPPHVVGGLGKHVMELLPALGRREGITVHLITPRWAGGERVEEQGNVVIHRVDPPATSGDIYTSAWQTNVELERYAERLWKDVGPFDLIHAHDWLVAFAANALKHTHKTPLIATIHATEKGRGRGHLGSDQALAIHQVEWWLTYEAWRVIACSEYMASEIREFFNCPADKIDIIPNGVDPTPFQEVAQEDLRGFRAMYALPEEQIVFNVGRIVYEKGVHVLVEAVPLVLAQMPTAKFVIAGRGPLLGQLRERAWKLGVGEKILFTGFISDEERNRLFYIADCAVFPSLYEPFGIVALEAMAAKCPVVVSEVGGLREVVKHAETGITIYPDNPDSLAWGIVHTLSRPDWARQRAENAYKMVLELYNWDRIAGLTVEVYRRVIEERRHTDW